MNKNTVIIVSVILLAALYLGWVGLRVGTVNIGATSDSIDVKFASTTQLSLAADQVQQIFATSTCAARVITTGVAGVGLSFFGQPLNSTVIGDWQAASTTKVYDGKEFGCGTVRARADDATTLTVKNVW